jgi:hypothetical protein
VTVALPSSAPPSLTNRMLPNSVRPCAAASVAAVPVELNVPVTVPRAPFASARASAPTSSLPSAGAVKASRYW